MMETGHDEEQGAGSEISLDECIILKSYETETVLLLHITKEVRGKGIEKTNILKKKLGKKISKYLSVLKTGKNKKVFISQNQKVDLTLTPQAYDRAGCKIMFLCHDNLKFQLCSCFVYHNLNLFKFFMLEKIF